MTSSFKASAPEVRWEGMHPAVVTPQRVEIVGIDRKWKVARCPWWVDAWREGDALVVQLRHCGVHHGAVRLESGAESMMIRVMSDVRASRSTMYGAALLGAFGAMLGGWPFLGLMIATVPPQNPAASDGWGYWLIFSAVTWLASITTGWGLFFGNARLALRSLLGLIVGFLAMGALIAMPFALEAGVREIGVVQQAIPGGAYARSTFFGLFAFPAVWGAVVGGWNLAWKTMLAGPISAVLLFLIALPILYFIWLFYIPFVILAMSVITLAAASSSLARIPARDAKSPRNRGPIAVVLFSIIAFVAWILHGAVHSPRRWLVTDMPWNKRVFAPNAWVATGRDQGAVPIATVFHTAPEQVSPGTRLWELALGHDTATSSAVGPDGMLHVVTENRLYAIDQNGHVRWQRGSGGQKLAKAAPLIASDGTLFVVKQQCVFALSRDGNPKWSLPLKPGVWQDRFSSDSSGTLYVSDNRRLLAATQDGEVAWNHTFRAVHGGMPEAWFGSTAVGPDGTLYVFVKTSNPQYSIRAFDRNGAIRWNCVVPEDSWGLSVGKDGTIYTGGKGLSAISPKGEFQWLYRYENDVPSGGLNVGESPEWTGRIRNPLVASDGTLRLSATRARVAGHNAAPDAPFDDRLLALESNGVLRWSFEKSGRWCSPAAIGADCTTYVITIAANTHGTGESQLHAIDRDGVEKWSVLLPRTFIRPLVGGENILYLVDGKGTVNGVKVSR